MSAAFVDLQSQSFVEEHSVPPGRGLVRTPLYWTSQEATLFGWWHTSSETTPLHHAVVIAPPIGYEQLHAHRSLRQLADALAAQGLPTLRFDWHGTGDSAGRDEDPQRLETWRANLRDAVAMLKQTLGVPHISVIGLRLGATLAATTLTAQEITNLVLWAPVISGRTYLREMTAIDRTSEIPPALTQGAPADLEPAGVVLSEATAKDISQINLLHSPSVACRTLIVAREELAADQRLAAWMAEQGIAIEKIPSPGYADMMADPHKGDVPRQEIQAITSWLAAAACPSPAIKRQPLHISQEMTAAYQPEGLSATTATVTIRERALRLSADPDLFGILSEPIHAVAKERPTIVLLNAGTSYRVGPGRLHVHLGRRLAANGFRCVRIDANGLGDSVAANGDLENQSYSATVLRDTDRTLQSLRDNHLGETFVVMGLCSGAYFAFQAAVSSTDSSLVESVLINPLTYFWKDGMVISESTDRQLLVRNYYFESALNPSKWLKLLSGQTKIGLGGATRMLIERLKFAGRRPPPQPDCESVSRPDFSHPLTDDLTADLNQAAARNRHLAMFFGQGDPGYGILVGKAGPRAKQLRRTGRLEIEFIANADHNFSRRSVRGDLIERLAVHLQWRYPD